MRHLLQRGQKSKDGCFSFDVDALFVIQVYLAGRGELENQPGIIPARFHRLYQSSPETRVYLNETRRGGVTTVPAEIQLSHAVPSQRPKCLPGDLFHGGGFHRFAHHACTTVGRIGAQVAVGHARCQLSAVKQCGDTVILAGNSCLDDG